MDFILIHKKALIKEVTEAGTLRGTHTFEFTLPMKGGREGSQSCRRRRNCISLDKKPNGLKLRRRTQRGENPHNCHKLFLIEENKRGFKNSTWRVFQRAEKECNSALEKEVGEAEHFSSSSWKNRRRLSRTPP